MSSRLSYDLSWARLRELGLLNHNGRPSMPERLPRYDDNEPLGFRVFRMRLDDALDLSELSLPRTFFGRSEIRRVSFRNSDLHESNLCWNDFIGTDFTGANLPDSDLRSSLFKNVLFIGSNLNGSDLRRSSFINCNFDRAELKGALLTREQGDVMSLSDIQLKDVDWRGDSGPEPEGG